jgi:hypothetical protein
MIPLVLLHYYASFYLGYIYFLLPKATFFTSANLPLCYVYIRSFFYIESEIFRFSQSLLYRLTCTITCIVHNLRGIFVPIPMRFIGKNTQKLFRLHYTKIIIFIRHHGSGLLTRSASTSFLLLQLICLPL